MIIIFLNFKNILVQQALEDQKGIILKGASDLDNIVYELDRITLYLCGDKSIPQLLESSLESDVDKLNFSNRLQTSVLTYTNYPITRASIDYYSMLFVADSFETARYLNSHKLDEYLTSISRTKTAVSNSNHVKNEEWYQKTIEYNTKVYSFMLDNVADYIFFSKLVKNIYLEKPNHGETIGVLVLGIKKNDILKILNSAKATENAEIILAYQDIVLAALTKEKINPGDLIPDKFLQVCHLKNIQQLHKIKYKNQNYLTIYSEIPWSLKVIAMVPERDITRQLDGVLYIVGIELLLVLIISLLISGFFSNIFTKPIIYLTNSMQKINNEEQFVEIPQFHNRNDEITYLYQSYNSMIKRISKLIEDIKYNMTLQKKSELKALQSQINPHFIYNALDTVNWMALCEGKKDISSLVTSLVDILRYSIREPEALVSLKEELSHLEKYLKIQKIRYENKFIFEMNVPETFFGYKLPKLTIQPLVENSLLHAINNQNIVNIKLFLETSENEIRIIVSNTGKLADAEIINRYLAGEEVLQSSGEGIGIRNLNKRIKMHFGNEYGLYYELRGESLAAVLVLPEM